jgi:hypothetical protein
MGDTGGIAVQNLGLNELNTVKEQLEQEAKQLNIKYFHLLGNSKPTLPSTAAPMNRDEAQLTALLPRQERGDAFV